MSAWAAAQAINKQALTALLALDGWSPRSLSTLFSTFFLRDVFFLCPSFACACVSVVFLGVRPPSASQASQQRWDGARARARHRDVGPLRGLKLTLKRTLNLMSQLLTMKLMSRETPDAEASGVAGTRTGSSRTSRVRCSSQRSGATPRPLRTLASSNTWWLPALDSVLSAPRYVPQHAQNRNASPLLLACSLSAGSS
eukprot:442368-Rhodomonas_salina.2